jgi:hypothetical protein
VGDGGGAGGAEEVGDRGGWGPRVARAGGNSGLIVGITKIRPGLHLLPLSIFSSLSPSLALFSHGCK